MQQPSYGEDLNGTCLTQIEYKSMLNTNFQFFVAMNTPFAASDVHLAPLSDIDDGCNDIVVLRGENGGRIRMASLLLALDNGEYFSLNEHGDVR